MEGSRRAGTSCHCRAEQPHCRPWLNLLNYGSGESDEVGVTIEIRLSCFMRGRNANEHEREGTYPYDERNEMNDEGVGGVDSRVERTLGTSSRLYFLGGSRGHCQSVTVSGESGSSGNTIICTMYCRACVFTVTGPGMIRLKNLSDSANTVLYVYSSPVLDSVLLPYLFYFLYVGMIP